MTTNSEAPVLETRRLTADEILQGTLENARNELRRSLVKLGFSGIAGGITMGLTPLGVSCIRAFVGDGGWRDLVAYLAYPLGFIAVIIGRAQLFTENTLYPVVLVLDERRHLVRMLRLWGTVFVTNVVGASIFAVLVAKSSALHPDILSEMATMGSHAASGDAAHFFWSGVVGGWVISRGARVVPGTHMTNGPNAGSNRVTIVVGAGRFAHCIAGSCEILAAVMHGAISTYTYFHWLLPATAGNICGGTVIVSLLNYGQVRAS